MALVSYERTKHGVRVRMADKIAALTLLFKHLGLLQERHHVTGDWNKLSARLANARETEADP